MHREALLILRSQGELFRFYADADMPGVPHVTRRHGTTPEDVLRVFFEGETRWNGERARFETATATHVLYWARHGHDHSVVVISCFETSWE